MNSVSDGTDRLRQSFMPSRRDLIRLCHGIEIVLDNLRVEVVSSRAIKRAFSVSDVLFSPFDFDFGVTKIDGDFPTDEKPTSS
jgi:hypothetical protein